MLCVQDEAKTMTRILLTLVLALATSLPAQSAPPRGGSGYRSGGSYHGSYHGGYRGGYYGNNHYHGTRWVVGVNVGYPGWGWPYYGGYSAWGYPYYPYPYYPAYYPAPIMVQQQPTTYVEQPAPQAQQQYPAGFWYYCADQGAYYPYVNECPAGWQRVAPQPAN
jgi:hypothetical protein